MNVDERIGNAPSAGAALASLLSNDAYTDHEELLADRIYTIRMRAHAVVADASARGEHDWSEPQWPTKLAAAESQIERRLARAYLEVGGPPMTRLRTTLGLTPSEDLLLWALVACEVCPHTRELVRRIGAVQTPDPTVDTLRRLVYGRRVDGEVWRELGEMGTLRRLGLVRRTDGEADAAMQRQTWTLHPRVLELAHGVLTLDSRVHCLARLDSSWEGPPEQLELSPGALSQVVAGLDLGWLVLVQGPLGSGRRSLLRAVYAERGLLVMDVLGNRISLDRSEAREQLRSLAREAKLLGATPLVRDLDALSSTNPDEDRIALLEEEFSGLVLATATRPIARRWASAPVVVQLAAISTRQRAKLWQRAVVGAPEGSTVAAEATRDAEALATMFPIAPALIHDVGRAALKLAGTSDLRYDHIEAGLRVALDGRLAMLATRVTVTQTWRDLILPVDEMFGLMGLIARVRRQGRVYEDWGFASKVGRGLGVSVLFSGPPGTGKTMAAGLLAKSIGTELYRVDLNKIVSKWIGETEKNLAQLFDAAEAGHAILLFDEADALFGKRTDVKSSNDRHANQEINFLLQRLESYTGFCILTTNHDTAIDDAFRRRLSLHVRFPMPEAPERLKIWEAMFPRSAPTAGDLDLAALAERFDMSGGHIRNAVLRAAFLAAEADKPIDAQVLRWAAEFEFEQLGRIAHGGADAGRQDDGWHHWAAAFEFNADRAKGRG